MKLRKILVLFLVVSSVFTACNKDDEETFIPVPPRDANEVYLEDIADIETYLQTHFYNYEEFMQNAPYSLENDEFQIVFDTIAGVNADKLPLTNMVDFKIVNQDDIDYKLYYLKVREGLGNIIHFTDQGTLKYQGISILDNFVFDGVVNEVQLNLLSVGAVAGVIPGFSQGIVEFKTSDGFDINPDGTVGYHNHGIGAVFIPSGLGYFDQGLEGVPSYTPLIFKINLFKRTLLNHDGDAIWSFNEDIDLDGDVYDDDTDGDLIPDFLDNDDDGDGYFTNDELEYGQYIIMTGDPEPILADNEFEKSRVNDNGQITINTVIVTDRNGDGTPDYLDINTIPE